MTAELAHVVQQLIVATQHVSAANRQGARLSPHEYNALQHLSRATPGLTPSQLGQRLGITTGSTTKLIDRLERRRLAVRKRDRSDRRSLTVVSTEKAQTIIDRETKQIHKELAAATATLGKKEREVVLRYLQQVVERFEPDARGSG